LTGSVVASGSVVAGTLNMIEHPPATEIPRPPDPIDEPPVVVNSNPPPDIDPAPSPEEPPNPPQEGEDPSLVL
jgi:hypothetical protein